MFNVLSFDPKRIKMDMSRDGQVIVVKKTIAVEHENIVLAQRHLLKHRPVIVSEEYGDISMLVAEIFEWNAEAEALSTFFCRGKNIEYLLRDTIGLDRGGLMRLVREIFKAFKLYGFMWGDFAPRNMIWNGSENIIWLVDFERCLCLKDCPVGQRSFNRYVRRYSREEFSCFLTEAEQAAIFDGFLDDDIFGSVPVELIASTRKRSLLRVLFGEKICYVMDEIRRAEDLMAASATPFLVNNIFYFPMDSLDAIGSEGGPDEYADTIIAISRLGNYGKFSYLKQRSAAL